MSKRARKAEAHVRLYRHELESAAYRSLSTDARALLVELRALYCGRENRIHLSIRRMQERLGIGQRRAQQARDDLIERGFIRLLTPGSFHRKVRHAAEFALLNEPLEDRDGATAPKDFMKWRPEKSTVAVTTTDGSCHDYRDPGKNARNCPDGSCDDYRDPPKSNLNGSCHGYTDSLPGGAHVPDGVQDMLLAAMAVDNDQVQLKFIIAAIIQANRCEAAA